MLYLLLVKFSLIRQCKYKADFIIQMAVWILYACIPFIGISILLERFGQIFEWDRYKIAVCYALAGFSYDIARMVGRGFDNFHQHIYTGSLDTYLIRPVSLILQIMGHDFFLRRLAGIIVYLAIFIRSSHYIIISKPTAVLVIAYGSIVISTSMLFFVLLLVYAITVIFSKKRNMFSDIAVDAAARIAYLPLEYINKYILFFFTVPIPLYYVFYVPIKLTVFESTATSLYVALARALGISSTLLILVKALFPLLIRKFYTSRNN